jgi:hypothetical protein
MLRSCSAGLPLACWYGVTAAVPVTLGAEVFVFGGGDARGGCDPRPTGGEGRSVRGFALGGAYFTGFPGQM